MAGAPAPICAWASAWALNGRAACATDSPRTKAFAGTAVMAPGAFWLMYVLWMLVTLLMIVVL